MPRKLLRILSSMDASKATALRDTTCGWVSAAAEAMEVSRATASRDFALVMAQVGHISPDMIKHYSHIRRQALNAAAAALEPSLLKPSESNVVELVN
jgi:predicted DNA-binding transcriptional regulator YafY